MPPLPWPIWLAVEPGLVRSLAFNTMLIASVSTVIFNGNPLLRFDGYYILCDLIEVPNLATRATQYYAYLAQRYLFGNIAALNPVSARGEAPWFLAFAPASLAYRLTVLFGIAVFVGKQFFFVGVVLATWTVFLAIVWPLIKMIRFILFSPALAKRRKPAIAVSSLIAATVALIVFVMPVPQGTVVRGLVWIPDECAGLCRNQWTSDVHSQEIRASWLKKVMHFSRSKILSFSRSAA